MLEAGELGQAVVEALKVRGSQVLPGAASHAALQPPPITATSHPTWATGEPSPLQRTLSALSSLQYPVAGGQGPPQEGPSAWEWVSNSIYLS